MRPESKIDFASLNERLLSDAASLLPSWLPGGTFAKGEYHCADLRGGSGSSFKVCPDKGGLWKDWAQGDSVKGGDLVSLYAAVSGVGQAEAGRTLAERYGQGEPPARRRLSAAPKEEGTAPVPMLPVPSDAPPLFRDPARFGVWNPRKGAESIVTPSAAYAYLDAGGALLGYVLRLPKPSEAEGKPKKDFLPVTFCLLADGSRKWSMTGFPTPRPLYGLDVLAAMPDAPVMLTEGEKCADAARSMAGTKYACVSWSGGTGGASHADWSPLFRRTIVIWPDADDGGKDAAERIAQILRGNGGSVRMIDVAGMPDKWDAADALADGWDLAKLTEWAKPRICAGKPKKKSETPRQGGNVSDLPDRDYKDKPLETIENLAEICRRLKIDVRYNVIRKEEEISVPNGDFSIDNRDCASLARIKSECVRLRMPVVHTRGYLTVIADANPYNPVAEWILSKPWDGVSRLPVLFGCVVAEGEEEDEEKGRLKDALIRRWMVSAVAAAFEPEGVSAHGVLVLQGSQSLGKTAFFKSLVPDDLGLVQDGFSLRLDSNDSVRQACSVWLTELGEIDSTFRKSDIAQLKSFLTRSKDKMRRAYAEKDSTYARRTVFFGSVNERNYLHDDTGNRRFWTIPCVSINYRHGLNMQQIWAEVYGLYKAGCAWVLSPDELDALNAGNRNHEAVDPIEERLSTRLCWNWEVSHWVWRTATDVLVEIGYDKPNRSDATRCAGAIRKLNGDRGKKSNGVRLLLVPPKKQE